MRFICPAIVTTNKLRDGHMDSNQLKIISMMILQFCGIKLYQKQKIIAHLYENE